MKVNGVNMMCNQVIDWVHDWMIGLVNWVVNNYKEYHSDRVSDFLLGKAVHICANTSPYMDNFFLSIKDRSKIA